VLQCVAVCCSVLQCVAVWFEVDLMCSHSFLIQSDLCIVALLRIRLWVDSYIAPLVFVGRTSYIYVYIYVHIHKHICTYCVCMYICIYMYIYVYILYGTSFFCLSYIILLSTTPYRFLCCHWVEFVIFRWFSSWEDRACWIVSVTSFDC